MNRTFLLVTVVVSFLAGCSTPQNHGAISKQLTKPAKELPPEPKFEDVSFEVKLPGPNNATLGARWWFPVVKHRPGTTVIFVPSLGNNSRLGIENGIAATELWAKDLARRGFNVLAYDARACSVTHDAMCNSNSNDDVDSLGPVAYAKDVDAACQFAQDKKNQRIVLWVAAKSVPGVLASSCAKSAAAIVLQAPVPDSIDRILPEGLRAAGDYNKANSLRATFDSIKANRFAKDAKIMGRSLTFWRAWIETSKRSKSMIASTHVPTLVLLGGEDTLYSPAAKTQIRALGKGKHHSFVGIEGADHNLLIQQQLSQSTVGQVVKALERLLQST